MLKIVRKWIAGLSVALVAASPAIAATPRVPPAARPALWSVSDADTTIYLFGTIHLLPEHYQWRSPKLEQAVRGADGLVVETIVDTKDPTKMMGALTSLAFTPGLPPLAARVPPDKRGDLADAIKMSGFAPQALDKMETWAAAFILLGNQFRNIGLKGGEGVEMGLRTSFAGAGKPIGELESNVEQLGFFDRLPESAQRELLLGSISKPKDMSKDFAGMLAAWSRGDVRAIARTFDHDLDSSPPLKQALITQRNQNWSRWIEQRLTVPGSVMVAVGAGHLAGNGSVIAMLERDGYKVRRLQ
jgi:uncharacterized protein YbaP (TraB family)